MDLLIPANAAARLKRPASFCGLDSSHSLDRSYSPHCRHGQERVVFDQVHPPCPRHRWKYTQHLTFAAPRHGTRECSLIPASCRWRITAFLCPYGLLWSAYLTRFLRLVKRHLKGHEGVFRCLGGAHSPIFLMGDIRSMDNYVLYVRGPHNETITRD